MVAVTPAGSSSSTAAPATPGPPAVLADAASWVAAGVPYLWGGVTRFGADCSGFVKAVFAEVGYSINGRTSQQQATLGLPVAGLAAAQPGDLIFYNYEGPNSHVAIYAGSGQQYAETSSGTTASLAPVDTAHLGQIRRYIDSAGNPVGPGITPSAPTVDVGQVEATHNLGGRGPGLDIPNPLNIPGQIAGDIAGGLVQPLISWVDNYAIRAALFVLGLAAIVVGLLHLTAGEENVEHDAEHAGEEAAPAAVLA